jgi:hypothetical protein
MSTAGGSLRSFPSSHSWTFGPPARHEKYWWHRLPACAWTVAGGCPTQTLRNFSRQFLMGLSGLFPLLFLPIILLNGRLIACSNNSRFSSNLSSSSKSSSSPCQGKFKPRKNNLATQIRVTPARQDLNVKGMSHPKRVFADQMNRREPAIYFIPRNLYELSQ